MNHKQALFLPLVCVMSLAAAYSVATAGDGASPMPKDPDDTIQVPPIDEVIVSGHKDKLSALRAEIVKAEDAYYDAYNQINTDAQYRTSCHIETATATRQRVHVCKPQFVEDAYDEALMTGGDLGSDLAFASFRIESRMPMYKAHMRELAHKDPNLRKALGRYYALTQQYGAVRKEKFKGKWLVWD